MGILRFLTPARRFGNAFVMAGLRHLPRRIIARLRIIRLAVRDNWRSRKYWATRPTNEFTENSYLLVPEFLDRTECERIVRMAEQHLRGPSHIVSGNCYTWVKKEAAHGRNSSVRELLNVNEIDARLASLLDSDRIQALFSQYLGERVEVLGFGIQLDEVNTHSKRGFHVDVLHPPLVKAFIYLNDVDDLGDGPYTIVPGSHRWWFRKFLNDVINACTVGSSRDMSFFVPENRVRTVLAPAGTMILSTQDAMHKGWGNQWRNPRYVLIAYGVTAPHFKDEPLSEGREFVEARLAQAVEPVNVE